MEIVGYVLLGLGAGAAASLLGIGGGVIFVPALVILFEFEQQTAQGTSLVVIVATVLVGAATHHRHGRVDWRTVWPLAVTGAIGGVLGSRLALAIDPSALRRLFAAFLVLIAIRMANRTRRSAHE
ncbi:MAG: sulfite exporter TauE/SafE family protein [Acidimicrobiia bacterium]|nr:sulfite exporter TauE/SafE family protein [Acidimicrobiia bacterium]MBT8214469.1 sulfite exporter TauE/SafE family protein [Acidimicrobiia bacterium]NNF70215.1 sulfite exporter TauE/SafE family protein [Acidimicrobiia bacterium]NNK92191.1 sulfite exporter TauE/SafE family protein [Acidimicrobiia bacterium]